jgi:hypothetical protein
MAPKPPTQKEKEEEIERLATETARLIREAEPGTQQQLAEAASAIIREESQTPAQETAQPASIRRPMNPLAAGLGLLVVGTGFSFLTPFIGLALIVAGIIAVVWGLIISWARK